MIDLTKAPAPLTERVALRNLKGQFSAIIDLIDNGQFRKLDASRPITVEGNGLRMHAELRRGVMC